jgi:hypothetical protein
MAVVEQPVQDVELEEKLSELRRLFETSRVKEARAFIKELVQAWPEDQRVQHWNKVLLGWRGCLERIRFALDPNEERFYFAELTEPEL